MKKFKLLAILCVLFLNFKIVKTEYTMLEVPLLGKTIYIDAGHGGVDPGSVYKDIYEKDITLSIALKLEEELIKKGAIVYMTRESDHDLASPNAYYRKRSDLGNRALMINNAAPDMYISIHLNFYQSAKWSGAQTFYTDKNAKNIVLAEIMQKNLKNELQTNREHKKINNMYMYDRINVPGILIEVGFLSNSAEREKLLTADYQKKIATVITKGIIESFNFGQ